MNRSHGTGSFALSDFAAIGENVVFETGVLVFHPENIEIGDNVYVGHNAILKGYFKNKLQIGAGTWIGQQVFIHSAGGIIIGENVGIGPGAKMLSSSHDLDGPRDTPILHSPIKFATITVGDGADVGVGAILMPGVSVGRFSQVAAGAVVTEAVTDYAVVAGVPAKQIRRR